jgi:hypothetical protein
MEPPCQFLNRLGDVLKFWQHSVASIGGGITHFGIFYFGLQDGQVSKSIFSAEYRTFRELLRDLRVSKGVTQAQLSTSLGMAQSFVSKYEMGERRLDFVEVNRICSELGISLEAFVRSYAAALTKTVGTKRGKAKGGSDHE